MSAWTSVARVSLCRSAFGGLLGQAPGARKAFARWTLNRRSVGGVFSGRFSSWDTAMAAIPAHRLAGWDNDAAADIFTGPLPTQPSIYATAFWLSQILRPGDRVLDLGGGAATAQRIYSARAKLPEGVSWTVVETPAMARVGAMLTASGDIRDVNFVDSPDAAEQCDVFFSAGAMQYMRDGLDVALAVIKKRPRAIIFNKLPLSDTVDYWTLQNFGPAVSPYRVWRRDDFVDAIRAQGYRLVDLWAVSELSCDIPFHPELCVPAFSGLTFART